MSKFKYIFIMGIQNSMEYRMDFLLSLVSTVFPIIMQVFLWTSLYAVGLENNYGYTYEQMILYTLMAGVSSKIVGTGFEYEINDDIKTGGLNKYIVKPINYYGYRICSFLGGKVTAVSILVILLIAIVSIASIILQSVDDLLMRSGIMKIFSRFKYYMSLLFTFAKYSFIEQMEYRLNFFAGIAVECGYMLIKLMYVFLIYRTGVEINGYTPDQMVIIISTYIFMTGVFMSIYPNFCAIPGQIRDGSFDLLLTKPINIQFIATLKKVDFGMPIPNVLCGIILIIYGWNKAGLEVSFITVIGFILFCISGIALTYYMFLIPELLSFWLVSNNGIHQLSESVRDFNNLPMNIYGNNIKRIGTFIIPIFIITNWPTMFVMKTLSPFLIIWGFIVPVLFVFLVNIIWKRALKHYSSANG